MVADRLHVPDLTLKSKRGRAEKVPVGGQGRRLRAPIKSTISSPFWVIIFPVIDN